MREVWRVRIVADCVGLIIRSTFRNLYGSLTAYRGFESHTLRERMLTESVCLMKRILLLLAFGLLAHNVYAQETVITESAYHVVRSTYGQRIEVRGDQEPLSRRNRSMDNISIPRCSGKTPWRSNRLRVNNSSRRSDTV